MNDLMMPETEVRIEKSALKAMKKPVLVKMARRLGWLGDDARFGKTEFEVWLSAHDEYALGSTFMAIKAEHPELFTEAPAKPPPAPKREVLNESMAAAQLAEALKVLVPAAAIDRDEVLEIVSGRIAEHDALIAERVAGAASDLESKLSDLMAGIKPKVERVYVRPDLTEFKVPEGAAHKCLDRVVKLAGLRTNILLVGPAGCGKTFLAHQASEALGMEFSSISCTAGMSESQLLGWLLPIGEAGRFEYVQSEFVRLYEHGGVYLLDEIDAADANTLMILNQALANGGFYVPQARRWVNRHPDFVCIAAANTYGHGGDMVYAGRERLDGATLDRFRTGIVTMDYDDRLEEALIDGVVLAWGRSIRMSIQSLKLRRVMSTRAMVGFSQQQAAYGWDKEQWEQSFFADWTRDELLKVGRG